MINQNLEKQIDEAFARADELMKGSEGHLYLTILKTRCENCGRSPRQKGRCSSWFSTFLSHLKTELETLLSKATNQARIEELENIRDKWATMQVHGEAVAVARLKVLTSGEDKLDYFVYGFYFVGNCIGSVMRVIELFLLGAVTEVVPNPDYPLPPPVEINRGFE